MYELKQAYLFVTAVLRNSESAIQRCPYENVFQKYAANLQENTHVEVWFQYRSKAVKAALDIHVANS